MQNQGAEHTAPNLLCFVLPFCNLHYEKFADGTVKCIEDEIPFDLPKGWEWERLSNIACFSGGKTPSTSDRACWGGNVLWVTSKDMKSKYIQSSMLKLSEKGLEQMQLYPANTLLLVTRSGILRHTLPVAILKKSATINQDIKAILPYISDLEEYIYICLKGMESRLILQYTKAGATVENINFDAFKRILLPIPPQKQIPLIISATIDAESIINILKINQENLIDTITKTKSKILDLAIRGKLVPQDPNDEPASVLLERIRAEKEELIRQGKIKRDKKDSVIFKGEDNSYYENLPDNWEWATLGMISKLVTKGTTPGGGNVSYVESGIGFLRVENIKGFDQLSLDNLKYVDEETHNNALKRSILQSGDILITIAGTLGKTAVVPRAALPLNANQAVAIVRLINTEHINLKYIVYALNAEYISKALLHQEVAMAIPNLSLENISGCVIPIPPFKEQNRIVDYIDNTFQIIDSTIL